MAVDDEKGTIPRARRAPSASLLSRGDLAVGAAAVAMLAVAVAVLYASEGLRTFLWSDGELFYRVALDPFGDGSRLRPIEAVYGNAYRFGRPLYPVVAWALVAGHRAAVRWSMLALVPVTWGVAVACASAMLRRAGREAGDALRVLLPGLWAATIVLVSESMVAALALLTCLLVLRGRRWPARGSAALMLLAKESAVVAVVPFVVDAARRRAWRDAIAWLATGVPVALWWVWVRLRIGTWPFRDGSVSRREAVGVPFVSYVRRLADGAESGHLVAFAIVGATVAAAVYTWRRRPGDIVAQVALAFAVVLVALGDNAVRFGGELIRLTAPAEVLVLVAFMRRSAPAEPWRA